MKLLALGSAFCVLFSLGLRAEETNEPQVYHWGGKKVEVQPAADVPEDRGCQLAGLFEAEAIADRYSYPNALPGADTSFSSTRAVGTVAANLNCGYWNFQAELNGGDFLPYQYSFGDRGWSNTDMFGEGGFDVFWRDPESYMIGAGVRHSLETEHFDGFGLWSGQHFDDTWSLWSGSVFAELYPSEQFTLGLTGFYEAGDSFDGFNGLDYQLRSFGGSAYARYYLTPNVRLSIRAIVTQTDNVTSNVTSNHMNAVASAFYKFDDSPVAVFGGVRYGSNDSNSGSSLEPNTFVQGFAGVQVALGAHANDTLLERDRNGVNLH